MSDAFEPQELPAEEPARLQCLSCATPLITHEGRNPLCSECREKAIRYPVPPWLRAFGVLILALLFVSLYRLPDTLSTAVHEKRAIAAMEKHRYKTAQRELELAVKHEPGFLEAQCRLIICAFHNEDLNAIQLAYKSVDGATIDDQELISQTNEAISKTTNIVGSDSLRAFLEGKTNPAETMTEQQLNAFLSSNPVDAMGRVMLASLQTQNKHYQAADSTLRQLLADEPDYGSAIQAMIAVKRELNQLDSAFIYGQRLMDLNRESPTAYGALARVLLKQRKDTEALKLAQEGLRIDPNDSYCLASLALIYHYMGKIQERDRLIHKAQADSSAASSFSYVSDVVSGKEIFRN